MESLRICLNSSAATGYMQQLIKRHLTTLEEAVIIPWSIQLTNKCDSLG